MISKFWISMGPSYWQFKQLHCFRYFSTGRQFLSQDTIYALASGGIRCAVSVIRVSGTEAKHVLQRICRSQRLPEPRKVTLRKLYDPRSSSILDNGLVIWFPAPKSYTGEDSCEFHVHGGRAVISGLLQSICSISQSCRMADPGEFTKRAFLNGKMDLTEVDGVGDLIAAETEMQRAQAVKQMSGSLKSLYESWRDRIAKCLANSEAFIDFGENDNIEQDVVEIVDKGVQVLIQEIKYHICDERKGEKLRTGVSLCVLGKPNVGKSSLLNLICERDAAIVSSIPGTTRDVIEVPCSLRGYPVVFADTAGIREDTEDVLECEGIRRALSAARRADLIVLMVDLSVVSSRNRTRDDVIAEEMIGLFSSEGQEGTVTSFQQLEQKTFVVANKCDLIETNDTQKRENWFDAKISCITRDGYSDFINKLSIRVASLCANPESESPYLTRERYRSHLENCCSHLENYLTTETSDLAIKAHILKNAMNSIGYITGHFSTEDILSIVFRDFCIGK